MAHCKKPEGEEMRIASETRGNRSDVIDGSLQEAGGEETRQRTIVEELEERSDVIDGSLQEAGR